MLEKVKNVFLKYPRISGMVVYAIGTMAPIMFVTDEYMTEVVLALLFTMPVMFVLIIALFYHVFDLYYQKLATGMCVGILISIIALYIKAKYILDLVVDDKNFFNGALSPLVLALVLFCWSVIVESRQQGKLNIG